jgi:hypothetical protein
MSNVMLDIFTMDLSLDFVSTVGPGSFNDMQKSCFNNLLAGLVFWDKLSMPSDDFIDGRFNMLKGDKLTAELLNCVTFIDTSQFISFGPILEKNDLIPWRTLRTHEEFKDKIELALSNRTGMYEKISSDAGVAYLPCQWRLNNIKKYVELNVIATDFSMEQIEDNIKINNECNNPEYALSRIVHFPNPLLMDYICRKAGPAPREQLSFVLQELRKDKDVINLRKSLNKIEKEFIPNFSKHIIKTEIEEISKDVFKKYIRKNSNKILNFDIFFGTSYDPLTGKTDTGMTIKNLSFPQIPRRGYLDKKFIRKLLEFSIKAQK